MNPKRRMLLLQAIPSTEPATFGEVLRALGDEAPERGDKAAFRDLFVDLERLEAMGLIEIDRIGNISGTCLSRPRGCISRFITFAICSTGTRTILVDEDSEVPSKGLDEDMH